MGLVVHVALTPIYWSDCASTNHYCAGKSSKVETFSRLLLVAKKFACAVLFRRAGKEASAYNASLRLALWYSRNVSQRFCGSSGDSEHDIGLLEWSVSLGHSAIM
jgi:hypothetical protein